MCWEYPSVNDIHSFIAEIALKSSHFALTGKLQNLGEHFSHAVKKNVDLRHDKDFLVCVCVCDFLWQWTRRGEISYFFILFDDDDGSWESKQAITITTTEKMFLMCTHTHTNTVLLLDSQYFHFFPPACLLHCFIHSYMWANWMGSFLSRICGRQQAGTAMEKLFQWWGKSSCALW